MTEDNVDPPDITYWPCFTDAPPVGTRVTTAAKTRPSRRGVVSRHLPGGQPLVMVTWDLHETDRKPSSGTAATGLDAGRAPQQMPWSLLASESWLADERYATITDGLIHETTGDITVLTHDDDDIVPFEKRVQDGEQPLEVTLHIGLWEGVDVRALVEDIALLMEDAMKGQIGEPDRELGKCELQKFTFIRRGTVYL